MDTARRPSRNASALQDGEHFFQFLTYLLDDLRADRGVRLALIALDRERVELAVRYCPTQIAPAGSQQLFGEEVMPVCSPALLKQGPPLRKPADLAAHTLIQLAAPPQQPGCTLHWVLSAHAVRLRPLHPPPPPSSRGGTLNSSPQPAIRTASSSQVVRIPPSDSNARATRNRAIDQAWRAQLLRKLSHRVRRNATSAARSSADRSVPYS